MRFRRITAHDDNQIRVLDINPVVGHRTATKCWSKTCYRWSVSDTRPLSTASMPRARLNFCDRKPVSLLAAEAHSMPVVSQRLTVTPVVGFDEVGVTVFFHQLGDAGKGVVPADTLPFVRPRRPVFRVLEAAFAVDEVNCAGAFRAKRTAVYRVIRIPSIWKMLLAFLAPSPRLYINSPQPTEQYVQVLRVSRARSSLYCRVSANATSGQSPARHRRSCHTASADLKELPSADLHGGLLYSIVTLFKCACR